MAKYKSVEGPFTTIDTLAELTTFLNVAAQGPIRVPVGESRLAQIIFAAMAELAAGEEITIVLQLSGDGIVDSPQRIILACMAGASGTIVAMQHAHGQLLDVDIAVKGGELITVEVGAGGTALSLTGQAGITLVFP